MRTYTYDEVRKASVDYFHGDQLAGEVFAGKYALRNIEGALLELSPSDMHDRLAAEFHRVESKYDNPMTKQEIVDLLSDWAVVPQGSPMSAVGNKFQFQSLSNCFVIESPYDSYAGIMKADQEQAQIMKRRGGVGFDISTIRPKGLLTANAARTTDGIGVFMERFSNTCREVAQGGRRGALMLTISVHHPEIRTFINIKRDKTKVTGANISIRLSDEFMEAVKSGGEVQLRFPVEKDVKHSVGSLVDARTLWNEIIEAAWESAEPGLMFWDTMKKMSPADAYESLGFGSTSTNPCGEIVLSPYDSCRLLLVNLAKFVRGEFTKDASFDYDAFADVVKKAQRLMDDLVDLELEAVDRIIQKIKDDPEPDDVKTTEINLWNKIKSAGASGRRTGLGITALGDALAMLGVTYGSDDSVQITDKIYRCLALNAWRSSVQLAKERGSFPIFDHELETDHPFIERILGEDKQLRIDHSKYGRRNIALTTTAPAGSVSIMTQTTSGCEPVFMVSYKRRKKINPNDESAVVDFVDAMGDKWQEFTVYHHGFKRWMDVTGKTNVEESPYWKSTSNDVDWVKKIDVQAAAQKWLCHSISNTTNLPSDATVDIVKQVYMRGWETGCKGVTIYRDGSRSGVLVTETKKQSKIDSEDQPSAILDTHAPKRPKELECDIHRANVKGESYLVLVGLMGDRPYEIFAGLSEHVEVPKKAKKATLIKNGKNKDGVVTYNLRIPVGEDDSMTLKDVVTMFDNPVHGALTRIISLSMRHGVGTQFLVEQLKKDKNSDLQSFSSVVARVLKNYIKDGIKSTEKMCGECGATSLIYQMGCVSCASCGWSKC